MNVGSIQKGELSKDALLFLQHEFENFKVFNVKTQVVSGILYRFEIAILDEKTLYYCNATLLEQPWKEVPYDLNLNLMWKTK